MTKARDLANAGTALTAVSATELGYLDGVTSAVQTQINAKQAVVSGVNDTEIGYLDGVTSAIQTQINAQIPKSTVTAKGDLLVATGSGTVVAQAVGSNGQVLTANSAQADGVEWASPAASGALTLVASASFSSVTAANVNNCFTSTYQNYLIVLTIDNYIIDQPLYLRYRASGADNSTTNYIRNFGEMISTGFANNYAVSQPEIRLGAVDSSWSNARFGAVMTVQNPQLAKATLLHHSCANTGYASEPVHTFGNAVFSANTQFDGFSIVTLRTDTMTGNYKVYGYAN
jgi:hypothetical protein